MQKTRRSMVSNETRWHEKRHQAAMESDGVTDFSPQFVFSPRWNEEARTDTLLCRIGRQRCEVSAGVR